MSLAELSIKRHVLAFMMSGVLALFGFIAYQRIGVDRFPHIEFPVISITTVLPGANPDIVDASITSIIETVVNSVPGIDHVQSQSSPGVSSVAVSFNLDKDVDVAFNEIQAKINQIVAQLPEDADPPLVAKVEVGASPIMWVALQGDRTLQQLNQYARNVLKKRLETIDGVGEVRLGGRRDRTIRVNLDVNHMTALSLTVQDVIAAFRREHLQLPGGFVVSERTESLLKLDLEFHSPEELGWMIVTYRDGAAIRLRDIASIEDALEDYRQIAHFNGKASVGLGIVKIANSNTVAIIDEVKRRLETDIIPQLPPGIKISIASDDSTFINEMIDTLKEHLITGTILSALIVLVFLKNIRSTLIIATAIPVSLLGAVAMMYFVGFTFNTMTLLALLLLVGVVVDDSIVVLENIYRHRETLGYDAHNAAIKGTHQVVFAVLAATLSLVSIFAPVMFLGGILGRFFESFAAVVTVGVLVSWFVSMTLTPMLCSRYLQVSRNHGKIYRGLEKVFVATDNLYRRLLNAALRFRWMMVLATVLIVLSSGYFFANVGKGFVPDEDEGRFMVIFKTGLGSNVDYTVGRLEKIETVLANNKNIATFFTAVGLGQKGQVNQGIAFVRLTPQAQRTVHQSEIVKQVRGQLAKIPGVNAFAMNVPIVGGTRGEPLQFAITGNNLQQVAQLSQAMRQKLSEKPELGRADLDLQLDLPQIQPIIDRTKAAALGVSTQDIATALNVLAGGIDVAKYNDDPGDGERYDIRLKSQADSFTNSDDLRNIYLRGNDGNMVRLDTIATLKDILGPAIISRLDLRYAANFFSAPSIPLGTAVDEVKAIAKEILPLGYTLQFQGEAEEFAKTTQYIIFAFSMAIVLLYMVLASQFNSFVQPFIIMVAQPLAMIGGVMALWLTNTTLNIYSMIGMVLLLGLVAKNSILLVDLTNQLRLEGKDIDSALREACPIRLRPVLMTSFTIILALLPAALGLGAGADTNGPLSIAVIGGMITSTLLTLIIVPAVYSLIEHGLLRIQNWRHQRAVKA